MTAARIFLAFLIAGVSLAAAVWLHRYEESRFSHRQLGGTAIYRDVHPSWADPVAIIVAFIGVGAGIALIVGRGGRA